MSMLDWLNDRCGFYCWRSECAGCRGTIAYNLRIMTRYARVVSPAGVA